MVGRWRKYTNCHFHFAYGFIAHILAHKLDSLVRVSRRVGGATDLLGREMRTATEHCSLYESSHVPVRCEARTPRAAGRTNNFTRGLRCAPNSSCRKLRGKCTRETRRPSSTVIADRILQSHATPRLSSSQKLREPLRLPPHSFTYY